MIVVTVVLLSVILTGSTARAKETLFGCEGETLHLRYIYKICHIGIFHLKPFDQNITFPIIVNLSSLSTTDIDFVNIWLIYRIRI